MSLRYIKAASARRDLPRRSRLLLDTLARWTKADGTCHPSNAALADEIGYSERTVFLAMKELEAAGLIARKARFRSDGARTVDLVTLFPNGFDYRAPPPSPLEGPMAGTA